MRHFRNISSCIVGVCVLASSTFADSVSAPHAGPTVYSATVEGYQFEVTSDQTLYAAGAPVYIDVWLKNTTDSPLTPLYPTQIEEKLNLMVVDAKGKYVGLTAEGAEGYVRPNFLQAYHKYDGPIRQSPETPLPAHQSIHYRILLSRLYDLSKEGAYAVTVSQWVPKQGSEGVATLTSPPLIVSISSDDHNTATPGDTNPHQSGGQGVTIGRTF